MPEAATTATHPAVPLEVAPAPLAATTDTAQTYGWDTVFAMHIAQVNAAIAAQRTSPPGFAQADAEEGYAIAGRFGDWAIIPGGDGDLVWLSLPVHGVEIKGPSGPWAATGALQVEVRLDLLHDADIEARRHLKVRHRPLGPGIPVATVVGAVFDGPAPPFLAATALKALMQDWLAANLDQFDHVFSTVDLDRRAASGAFQWMQPTDIAYAYTDLGTVADGALAILAMTGGRPSTGLIQQVSSSCLPPGQTASLLIARPRVMEQLLLPTIPRSYKGSAATDFLLSTTGQSIIARPGGIDFTLSHDGTDYTSTVESLTLTINASELVYDVTTKTNLSPGVRAWCRTINRLHMTLGTAADGGQTLTFADAEPPDINHWTDHDAGIDIAEKVLAIAALVGSLVATVLTEGAAVGTLALAIGFAAGALAATDAAIEMAGRDKAPAITAAILDATAAITWPACSGFVLSQAGLNDSLQLAGAYQAQTPA